MQDLVAAYVDVLVIWVGDVSCVLDGDLDICRTNHNTKLAMTAALIEVTINLGCVAIWRTLHPTAQEYSCPLLTPNSLRPLISLGCSLIPHTC